MIAVDKSVVVRFLVADHPAQASAAKRLFAENTISIARTVLLETEWVLRGSYGFERRRIADAFRRLLAIPTVSCPRRDAVLGAVDALANGCDFADALHALSVPGVGAFATFDRTFARAATGLPGLPPVQLLATS